MKTNKQKARVALLLVISLLMTGLCVTSLPSLAAELKILDFLPTASATLTDGGFWDNTSGATVSDAGPGIQITAPGGSPGWPIWAVTNAIAAEMPYLVYEIRAEDVTKIQDGDGIRYSRNWGVSVHYGPQTAGVHVIDLSEISGDATSGYTYFCPVVKAGETVEFPQLYLTNSPPRKYLNFLPSASSGACMDGGFWNNGSGAAVSDAGPGIQISAPGGTPGYPIWAVTNAIAAEMPYLVYEIRAEDVAKFSPGDGIKYSRYWGMSEHYGPQTAGVHVIDLSDISGDATTGYTYFCPIVKAGETVVLPQLYLTNTPPRKCLNFLPSASSGGACTDGGFWNNDSGAAVSDAGPGIQIIAPGGGPGWPIWAVTNAIAAEMPYLVYEIRAEDVTKIQNGDGIRYSRYWGVSVHYGPQTAGVHVIDLSEISGDATIGYTYFCPVVNAGETVVFPQLYLTNIPPTPDTENQSEIYLTKSGNDFIVGINDWSGTHKYQIWTYQEVASGILNESTERQNQWILSLCYTSGLNRSPGGFKEAGESIIRNIGPFASVDSNYTVAVKVIDGAGNFVGQYKDTFTQAEAGEVVINKVTVDGVFADDKAFVKDIANDSPVAFVVTGNGVAGTEYTAKVDQTGDQLVASGAGLNEFSWNISGMQPGNYSVTLTASTADSSDSRTVNINLYKNDPAVVYGEMTELVVTGAAENDNFKIDINPTVTGGKFRYRISEPWRGIIAGGDSGLMNIPAGEVSNTVIPKTAYGVYEVQTYTYRNGVLSADDGAVRMVTNARPGGSGTLSVTVDGAPAGTELITKAKGTAIVFTPEATGIPTAEYSFWRRDANGWVLIRDYANEGLTWTPNRVGLYTVQVRAKEAGGLTYEVLKNIEFNINEVGGDKIADVANITINQAALDTDAKARTPILITANATSAEQDLLYKFIISNGYIYYVETAYSADPTYMWVPGKSGNYTIDVLVKNQASFGKYDAVDTFTVTVN